MREKHNQVKALQRTRRYRIDCKDQYITIYESNAEVENVQGIFADLLQGMNIREGLSTSDAMGVLTNVMDQNYTAMLRFCLEDKEKRIFLVERFCFRSGFDKWIYLAQSEDFRGLVREYVDMLGTDKFFESSYY